VFIAFQIEGQAPGRGCHPLRVTAGGALQAPEILGEKSEATSSIRGELVVVIAYRGESRTCLNCWPVHSLQKRPLHAHQPKS
jgi:hypothetical protein